MASLGPAARAGLTFLPTPQYMMLSGQVPFQGASGQGGQSQAAEIDRGPGKGEGVAGEEARALVRPPEERCW